MKKLLPLLLVLFCFQLSFAQEKATASVVDQKIQIQLDESKAFTNHYQVDATDLINQLGDELDTVITLLTDDNMKFVLNKSTKKMDIKILRSISIKEEWSVEQWNDFLKMKIRRAYITMK